MAFLLQSTNYRTGAHGKATIYAGQTQLVTPNEKRVSDPAPGGSAWSSGEGEHTSTIPMAGRSFTNTNGTHTVAGVTKGRTTIQAVTDRSVNVKAYASCVASGSVKPGDPSLCVAFDGDYSATAAPTIGRGDLAFPQTPLQVDMSLKLDQANEFIAGTVFEARFIPNTHIDCWLKAIRITSGGDPVWKVTGSYQNSGGNDQTINFTEEKAVNYSQTSHHSTPDDIQLNPVVSVNKADVRSDQPWYSMGMNCVACTPGTTGTDPSFDINWDGSIEFVLREVL